MQKLIRRDGMLYTAQPLRDKLVPVNKVTQLPIH